MADFGAYLGSFGHSLATKRVFFRIGRSIMSIDQIQLRFAAENVFDGGRFRQRSRLGHRRASGLVTVIVAAVDHVVTRVREFRSERE